MNVCDAPDLYLGNTRLLTGKRVLTDDLRRFGENPPIMGILGMDCLRHYCIQLNFSDHKIRFLDPDHSKSEILGEKFPLAIGFFDDTPSIRTNFLGQSDARWEIDTGLAKADVAVTPKQLRELQKQTSGQFISSMQYKSTNGSANETFYFSHKIIFNNETYTNFIWRDARGENLIGLRFLSRYLTTLNFPKRTMYLEHSNAGSLADSDGITNFTGNVFAYDFLYTFVPRAEKFLAHLGEDDQLPGWSKNEWEKGGDLSLNEKIINLIGYPFSATFILTEKGDASKYHYTVVQPSKNSPLKLQRAWRTDANGKTLEEYPVP